MREKEGRPRVVAISGDPGGARAMAPVLGELRAGGRVTLDAYAYKQAHALWTDLGIDHVQVPDPISLPEVEELVSLGSCDLLLTSTSFGGIELEKELIGFARRRGVPSLTLLDTWGNYSQRFSDGEGRLVYLPDRIAVIDDLAYREMVEEGFDPGLLVITGQPAFDGLRPGTTRRRDRGKRTIMGKFPVGPGEVLVLFASQPLSQIYGTGPSSPRYPGFDEWKVLRLLIEALDAISSERNIGLVLVIRPHPREDPAPYLGMKGKQARVLVTGEGDARDWIRESDLVAGMNSILLVEACYLGVPVISLQPDLRGKDMLPTNQAGLSRAVYRGEEIRPAIEEVLFNTEVRESMISRMAGMPRGGQSTRRVAALVYSMTGVE